MAADDTPSIPEIANLVGVSSKTIRRKVTAGQVRATKGSENERRQIICDVLPAVGYELGPVAQGAEMASHVDALRAAHDRIRDIGRRPDLAKQTEDMEAKLARRWSN